MIKIPTRTKCAILRIPSLISFNPISINTRNNGIRILRNNVNRTISIGFECLAIKKSEYLDNRSYNGWAIAKADKIKICVLSVRNSFLCLDLTLMFTMKPIY